MKEVILAGLMLVTYSLYAGTDEITFFVASDMHYKTKAADGLTNCTMNRLAIDDMNKLPGQYYPKETGGGKVEVPLGVCLLGDLIDDGNANDPVHNTVEQWQMFSEDFGVAGEGRCKFSAYECWGNHDGGPVGMKGRKSAIQVQEEIVKRTRKRSGLTSISENGMFYSWNWGCVHFVNVGLYPGKTYLGTYSKAWHDPQHSLGFLVKDLADNVGKSGRPVIVMHHFDIHDNWWTESEKRDYAAVLKDYNVILIMYGHTGTGTGEWKNDGAPGKIFSWLNDGHLAASYFVVNITKNQMMITQRVNNKGVFDWGRLNLKKKIETGESLEIRKYF